MFGKDTLPYLRTLKGHRAVIVMRGDRFARNGILDIVGGHLAAAGIEWTVFDGVEPDPRFSCVKNGAEVMNTFRPDLIIALGGGSAMDAAKAMWVFYEHPELKELADILPPNKIPPLRRKARMACIPSTAGSASEVSRSIVITDDATGIKHGIGDMEMVPDIAICDPSVTVTMSPQVTADSGMDALTHATEAYVSTRANYVSDILALAATRDIVAYLPKAYDDGANLDYRERMLNASMVAGLAFTNVSLGIVHSMAHSMGSLFGIAHGLANAVLLPYVVRFNSAEAVARDRYAYLGNIIGVEDFAIGLETLRTRLGIPPSFRPLIPDEKAFLANLPELVALAQVDGCTKTNPIIPTADQFRELYTAAYFGESAEQR